MATAVKWLLFPNTFQSTILSTKSMCRVTERCHNIYLLPFSVTHPPFLLNEAFFNIHRSIHPSSSHQSIHPSLSGRSCSPPFTLPLSYSPVTGSVTSEAFWHSLKVLEGVYEWFWMRGSTCKRSPNLTLVWRAMQWLHRGHKRADAEEQKVGMNCAWMFEQRVLP